MSYFLTYCRGHGTSNMTSSGYHGFAVVVLAEKWFGCLLLNSRSNSSLKFAIMREIVHLQAGQCGNQIGAKVSANIRIVDAIFHKSSAFVATSMTVTFDGCEA